MYILSILYITIKWNESNKQNKLILCLTSWLIMNKNEIVIELYNGNVIWSINSKYLILLGTLSLWLYNKNWILLIYSLLGSIIILESHSKLIFVLSLELESYSIYLIISKTKSLISLNYYLLGSLSSVIILLGLHNIWWLLWLGVIFKLSLFPNIKFWVDIYNKLSLSELIYVMNVPKISIILWLIENIELDNVWLTVLVLTSLLSSVIWINTSSLKSIITYSSINQVSIILILLIIQSEKVLVLYILQYILTSIIILKTLNNTKLEILNNNTNYNKVVLVLNLLSLISIPLTLGFWSKWYLLELTVINKVLWLILLVLLTSLLIGYIYLKIMNSILIVSSIKHTISNKWVSISTLLTTLLVLDSNWVIHLVEFV